MAESQKQSPRVLKMVLRGAAGVAVVAILLWMFPELRLMGGPGPDQVGTYDPRAVLDLGGGGFLVAGGNDTFEVKTGGPVQVFVARYGPYGRRAWYRASGLGAASSAAVVADDGSSVVTGAIGGELLLDADGPAETKLSAPGPATFLARYDGEGELRWGRVAGRGDGGASWRLAPVGHGDVVVAGSFEGALLLGEGAAGRSLNAAGQDGFISRWDREGALLWAKRIGGAGPDSVSHVAAAAEGSFVVAGELSGTVTFGAGGASTATVSAPPPGGLFVARYDGDGELQWVRTATSSERIGAGGLAAASIDGGAVVLASIQAPTTVGAGSGRQVALEPQGHDVFLARWSAEGELLWARLAAGSGRFVTGADLALAGSGDAYVTGFFAGRATFGPDSAGETTLSVSGESNMFVARYDPQGALQWVRESAGVGRCAGQRLSVGTTGAVTVAGVLNDLRTFGQGDSQRSLEPRARRGLLPGEMFLARYSAEGTLEWATDGRY